VFIINGILIGLIATAIFDLFQSSLSFAYQINKPKWHLVGRYFASFKDKIYYQDDIENKKIIKNELVIGYFIHYLIGIIYGIIYIIFNMIFFGDPSLFLALTIGFITVLGNWCIMMPFAFNIGFFASKINERIHLLLQNLISHFIFGMGLLIGHIVIS